MSTRMDIINQFKTDVVDSVKSSRGYNTDPVEVILGIINFDDIAMRPVLGYWAYSDEKDDEFMDDERRRVLNFIIYGYTDTDGLGDYEAIYNFADDIERFIMSTDWTYTDCTLLQEITITVGGSDNERCMFDLNIQVQYIQEF